MSITGGTTSISGHLQAPTPKYSIITVASEFHQCVIVERSNNSKRIAIQVKTAI